MVDDIFETAFLTLGFGGEKTTIFLRGQKL